MEKKFKGLPTPLQNKIWVARVYVECVFARGLCNSLKESKKRKKEDGGEKYFTRRILDKQ